MTPTELRAWMAERGIRNATLAEHLGVQATRTDRRSQSATVTRWLTGKTPIPAWVPVALRGIESNEQGR